MRRSVRHGQENRKLVKWDHTCLWKPFTQMEEYLEQVPVIIEKARGPYLFDTTGRRLIDGNSSLWVNTLGHNHPELNRALRNQLQQVAHSTLLGLSNVPAVQFARELVSVAPSGLTRVFYSDNGSTACEIALKMAYQFHYQNGNPSRNRFITVKQAYHGDTVGSVSLGGIDLFHRIYKPLLFKKYSAPSPYCYRCELKKTFPSCGLACAEKIRVLARRYRGKIAGVFLEPLVQGAAGIIVQPPGYLKRVEEICKEEGLLLICDEVATGFGRTGKLFACEHEGVKPDIIAVAKGITGGYLPLAATLTTERIFEGFLGNFGSLRTFYHGHTYSGNQLGCAVALKHLEILRRDRVLSRIKGRIEYLKKLLGDIAEHPNVGQVRQAGFMVGIELVADKKTGEPFPYGEKTGYGVCEIAIRKGLWVRPLGNVIVLVFQLVTTRPVLKRAVSIVRESIEEYFREGK